MGDRVRLRPIARDQAVVDAIETRRNCVTRSDGGRTKLLAANVDQAAIVISGEPLFSEALLMRVLAVLHTEGVSPLILATKTDLHQASLRVADRLERYRALGYPVIALSVTGAPQQSLEALRPALEGRLTLLLGQSGMGKSTLVNLLAPEAAQATREISVALSTGRHTTSFCRMFPIRAWGAGAQDTAPGGAHHCASSRLEGSSDVRGRSTLEGPSDSRPPSTWVIDSPGFQLFGLAHLSSSQLMHSLPDFASRLGQCRFSNCLHLDEPGCAIREALEQEDPLRLHFYRELLAETERPRR